jgi:hypothetical protein
MDWDSFVINLKVPGESLSTSRTSQLAWKIGFQNQCIVQPIAFGVSFNLILQAQSLFSLFNGTWQKRSREQDYRLRFEIEEMTLQMQ